MKRFFGLLILPLIVFGSNNQLNAQDLNISIGTGFGNENRKIETLETDYFYLRNREIQYVKAAQFLAELKVDEHVDFGLDISYTWASLDWQGQVTNVGPTINELRWTSFGGWGKYTLFPQRRLQLGIIASVGIHMGYPKRMNLDTVEKGVVFYAGLHAGPQFKVSDHFMLGYYYGRGKYNNSILFTYSL